MFSMKDASETALSLVGKLKGNMKKLAMSSVTEDNDSLISVSRSARVEPITMIDARASQLACLGDVLQSMVSIFTGYYLQAVALSVKVGRVNTLRLLDTLSPTRDVGGHAGAYIPDSIMMSMESFQYRLPDPSNPEAAASVLSLEEMSDDEIDKKYGKNSQFKKDRDSGAKTVNADPGKAYAKTDKTFDGDVSAIMRESTNLSVGKMFEVTIEDQGTKAAFPMMIRLISTVVDWRVLTHILADGNRGDTSLKERWHGFKSKQLQFWRDLVFCQDLIDQHRETLMKDGTEAYGTILRRRTVNAGAALLSGQPSIGTASNLVIITQETAKDLERQIGGRLKDYNVRQRVFHKTYMMIMAVIDTQWEQVTFYYRGIATGTTLNVKELKTANKGSGPDVFEILKAFQLGSNPTI